MGSERTTVTATTVSILSIPGAADSCDSNNGSSGNSGGSKLLATKKSSLEMEDVEGSNVDQSNRVEINQIFLRKLS